jgi:hypothetical protein
MITVAEVRAFVEPLPRSYEVLVHDRVKWRVGQIVYLAFSRDETALGFAVPKEERQMLVDTYADKFTLPRESDMRFNWVVARCEALEQDEMEELVIDAWRMVVPQKVWREYAATAGLADGGRSRLAPRSGS